MPQYSNQYLFSSAARSALVQARVKLGNESLKEILKVAIDAVSEADHRDLAAGSSILELLGDTPKHAVEFHTNGKGIYDCRAVEADKLRDGTARVNVYTLIADAVRDDITGFVLEAIQLYSGEPLSLAECDKISKFINEGEYKDA